MARPYETRNHMGLLQYARTANYKRFYGDLKEISKKNHKPAWLMFADAGICFLKYRSVLQDYLNFKFYEKSAAERATYVTTGDEYYAYQYLAGIEYAEFFSDKINFHKNFAKYAKREYCAPDDGLEAFEAFCERHPSFVKKPRFGLGGGGVVKVDAADIADKAAYLEQMRANDEFVEELVVQDPRWEALSPSTNTLRVMTFAHNDQSRVVMAVARVGSGASIMDNFHQGGMGVLIDMDRGCLVGNGFDKKVNESPTSVTGVVFDGYPIPYWDEVKEMVCEAALVNQGVNHIGWDVALSVDGPLIIEANRGPGWDVTQVPAKHGQKALLNEMLREVGAPERP